MLPKHIEDLNTNLSDMLDSVKAIKGEGFMRILIFMSNTVHLTKMIATATQHLDQENRNVLSHMYAKTMEQAVTLLFEAYNFKEQDEDELLSWADKISDQVDSVVLNKKGGA